MQMYSYTYFSITLEIDVQADIYMSMRFCKFKTDNI